MHLNDDQERKVLSPPDFISQLIVLIPMALLYEVSIYLVVYAERRSVLTN